MIPYIGSQYYLFIFDINVVPQDVTQEKTLGR